MTASLSRRSLMVAASALAFSGAAFSGPDWDGYPRLMQGPMVGVTEVDSVTIWMRASGPYPVLVEYSTSPDFSDLRRSEEQRATPETDYVVTCRLEGLSAGATVYYRPVVDGEIPHELRSRVPFQTRAAIIEPASFCVAFGSCARIARHPIQPVWDAISDINPDLFFWLGDNIYGDSLDPTILAEEYRKQRSVPNFGPLGRSVPQLAIWDDHDYGLNDHDRRHPAKAQSLDVFKRYWANPSYGLEGAPGVFFKYAYGGVDFFFLDNRYYKDPADAPDDANKSLLGQVQLNWLKQGLQASQASFKVLIAGIGFTEEKGPGQEAWSSYLAERNALFDFITENAITGVVLMSGDTHIAELNSIPWSHRGGYDLYEFVSSPLAQECSTSWLNYGAVPRIRQIYSGGPNFGYLRFYCDEDDPRLTFNIQSALGGDVWSKFEVRASELRPGVQSYLEKMDARSRARWERHLAGGPYYG